MPSISRYSEKSKLVFLAMETVNKSVVTLFHNRNARINLQVVSFDLTRPTTISAINFQG